MLRDFALDDCVYTVILAQLMVLTHFSCVTKKNAKKVDSVLGKKYLKRMPFKCT